jgi:hypothetical protein
MTTFTKTFADGKVKTYKVVDGHAVEAYKNAAGRTTVVLFKIEGDDMKRMEFDRFVVERDIDNLEEIKGIIQDNGFSISAEVVNDILHNASEYFI